GQDHLQLQRAAPSRPARGHRPHLEPGGRPPLRALLLPGIAVGETVGLDLEQTREVFEASTDFTVGLEEEFAIVDPASLELAHRFEDLYGAGLADEVLADSLAGELIDTEIEIRSGRGVTFDDAAERQRERRARLFALAERM